MRNLIKIFTIVLFVVSIPTWGNVLNFQQYKAQDGLSFNNVDFLAEDDEGLIYAPTNLGLNIFDGSRFLFYNEYNTKGFCNKVSTVLAFIKGYVLIGTVENGLFLFDKFKEKIVPLPCKEKYRIGWVTDMQIDSDRQIWIGCADGKLYCVDSNELVANYKKNEIISLTQIAQLPPLRINCLEVLDKGILLGNDGPLVYRIRKNDSEFIIDTPLKLSDVKRVYKISLNNSILFFGTERGLFRLDNPKLLSYNETISLSKPWQFDGLIIRSISFHHENLWIGTEGQGIFRLSAYTVSSSEIENFTYSISKRHGINSNYILCSLIDSNENLWIGTWFGGINKLDLKTQSYSFVYDQKNENDIFSNITWCAELENDQKYWIGTHGNGLCHFQPDQDNYIQIEKNQEIKSISSLYFDRKNDLLYIGTWGNGIKVYNSKTMKRQNVREISFASLASDRIYSIVADPAGNLWFGCFKNGLQYFDSSTLKLEKIELKNEHTDVRFLLPDFKHKLIWLGSLQEGLFKLEFSEQWKLKKTNCYESFEGTDERIKPESLYLDKKNRLWILSRDGIGIMNETDLRPKKLEPLKGNITTGMTEDANGFFWVSTYKGIYRMNSETLETEPMLTDYAFHSVTYNSRYNLLLATSDEGLVKINPDHEQKKQAPPKILLSNLKIFDQEILPEMKFKRKTILNRRLNYCDTLVIPHFCHTFSIRLNALSFSGTQKEVIRYKLENFEEIWNEQSGTSATAVYTNVPPGKYRLKVKVSNDRNSWTAERELFILKMKPWWGTNLAWFFYFLLAGGIVYSVVREINLRIKIRQELKIEKIKQEREAELYQQKAVFFTNISHDLRTPLTLIIGPLEEMVASNQFGEKAEQTMQRMLKNARMLLGLINQILDVRKAETNNLTLELKKIGLNAFLRNVYFQFNELAKNKKIDLDVICPEEPVTMIADPQKLESILFNLLSNAIKFTPSYESILIEVKEEADKVTLIISDTGIGMEEADLPLIFNRFYQSKPVRNLQSSGIGLNLVKRYVNLHGGEITVQSSPGKGSRFAIQFPRFSDPENYEPYINPALESVASILAEGSSAPDPDKKQHVLIVIDDHQDILEYLRDILSSQYQVFTATNGKDGINLVARKNPDLVISDVMMDDMDGLAVCKHIKTNLVSSHIPVILLTAKNTVEARIDGFNSGADEYIEKPFNSKLLLTRVRTLIEHRRLLKKKFLLSDLKSAEVVPSSVDEIFMKRIVEIIETYMTDSEFSLQRLMDEMKMSQDQLYRKIKALTGLSINHFIRLLRLKKAAQLLKSKKFTVSEVLFQTGFNNPSYFTKCFKAEYGVLPSEYVQTDQSDLKNEDSK